MISFYSFYYIKNNFEYLNLQTDNALSMATKFCQT